MGDGLDKIHRKIESFQRRYYLNIFVKGSIFTLAIISIYLLLAALLEHTLWLSSWMRLSILSIFFITVGYCVYHYLKEPLQWWISRRGIGEEQSAKIIGNFFPSIKDRLVNLLQLSGYQNTSSLAYASVKQRASELEPLPFESIIDIKKNRRFLKYLFIPVGIILVIFFINKQIITESTHRIINFNEKFSPKAPFDFIVNNSALTAFYNEDFVLNVELKGQAIPENVYIQLESQRVKMTNGEGNTFHYTFESLQTPLTFQLEASGFYSARYSVEILNRPELTNFEVDLTYPSYINKKNERLRNAGNLEIPEGTQVRWNLSALHANKASFMLLSNNSLFDFQRADNQNFTFEKGFKEPEGYEIILENNKSKNNDRLMYQIDVIKDQFPQISVNSFKDSVLYKRLLLGGVISDDYGVTQLSLNYRITDEQREEVLSKSQRIAIERNQLQQSFVYNWSLDSLQLKAGHQLEYYLQVWDNDGVNGRKSTKTATYSFFVPTEDKLISNINKSRQETQEKIDQSAGKAKDLQQQIEEATQRLKGKQSLDWQDKKMLEDILNQKKNLDRLVEDMAEKNKDLQDKKEAFTEQDERIKEKAEQIQKLMDELLDEETKKLFEELQKLLEENSDVSQLQKLLEKLNQNADNIEKELDRMLELFKEIEFESKFNEAINQLENQIEKQEKLMEKTESLEKNTDQKKPKESETNQSKENSSKLAEEQQQLKEQFENTKEQFEELRELGKEINQDQDVPSEEESDEIMQNQQESQEMLEQNQPSKSKQSQQKALQQMQEMKQQMQDAQSSAMMEIDMQNLEMLRQILHGLIKLSFDQENLMKSFNELQSNDPRFNALAEGQLKLRDNAQVLEDSLQALAKRDPFMGSIITKEISELNNHLEKVTEANRERRKPQAQNEMQLSMTSINNLALMLDSHFDMMMQMMANAKPSMGKKSKQKGDKPSLSQLQQQLNQKINDLKNSGKSGRQLSEELAEMAAEQERIRRALQEMQEKLKQDGQMPGGDLPSKMEQTEMDLVNKNLTEQMIRRQQEILTRLLETEKSMREQDMDDERKGETAKDYDKEMPRVFEDYLRLKEKEVELLKTVPPKLYPYYKKEVDEYFKRLGNP